MRRYLERTIMALVLLGLGTTFIALASSVASGLAGYMVIELPFYNEVNTTRTVVVYNGSLPASIPWDYRDTNLTIEWGDGTVWHWIGTNWHDSSLNVDVEGYFDAIGQVCDNAWHSAPKDYVAQLNTDKVYIQDVENTTNTYKSYSPPSNTVTIYYTTGEYRKEPMTMDISFILSIIIAFSGVFMILRAFNLMGVSL